MEGRERTIALMALVKPELAADADLVTQISSLQAALTASLTADFSAFDQAAR
jgi:hypothetical protein